MSEFNRSLFQSLLRKGIGDRSQIEFAKEVGISHVTLNRMLNSDNCSKPREETLKTISANVKSVTLNELLCACGYDKISADDYISQLESDMEDFFCFSLSGTFPNVTAVTQRLEDFCKTKNTVLSVKSRKIDKESLLEEIKLCDSIQSKMAEDCIEVTIHWSFEEYSCKTTCMVFFVETKQGNIIVLDFNLKETKTFKNFDSSPEGRLYSSIFGDYGSGEYEDITTTHVSVGIKADNSILPNFKSFIMAHSETLCVSSVSASACRKCLDGKAVSECFTEEVLKEYGIGFCVRKDEMIAVELVAYAISCELNKPFYVDTDVESGEVYIALPLESDWHRELHLEATKLAPFLYQYAKELGLSQFGLCYIKGMVKYMPDHIYTVEKFFSK